MKSEPKNLLMLLCAYLLYLLLGLLVVEYKYRQLAAKVGKLEKATGCRTRERAAIKAFRENAREYLFQRRISSWVANNFTVIVMSVYLASFTIVGLSFILFDAVRSGEGNSLLVTSVGTIVTMVAVALKLQVEMMKTALERGSRSDTWKTVDSRAVKA